MQKVVRWICVRAPPTRLPGRMPVARMPSRLSQVVQRIAVTMRRASSCRSKGRLRQGSRTVLCPAMDRRHKCRVGENLSSNRTLLVSLRCVAMDGSTSALAGTPLCSRSLSVRTTGARRHTSLSMINPSAVAGVLASCLATKVRYLLTRSSKKLLRPDTSGRYKRPRRRQIVNVIHSNDWLLATGVRVPSLLD